MRAARTLLLLALAAPAAQAQDPRALPADEVLIELRLGRLAALTVPAFRRDTTVLVPLGQFFDMAEIRSRALPGGGLEATIQPGNRRLAVGAAWDTLSYGERRLALSPGTFHPGGTDLFLDIALLRDLLELSVIVDWRELTVTVMNPEILPLGRRLEREAARRLLSGAPEDLTPDLTFALDRGRWGGMVLDYSILSPADDPLGGGAYSAGLGLDLLGGSLEVSSATVGPAEEGRIRTDLSWSGVWRGNPRLSQARLGDGLSTGPRPRSVRGFSLTNAPYVRPTVLGVTSYVGRLGPGWQIEAYRGGRLIAFDSVDGFGRFGVDLPVQYGENPVEFVAYGPFGEIREFNQTYRVGGDILPAGRFEYGVAAGECRADACHASANLDLRYGLGPRWSVQAGLDQFWRDGSDLFHPYAGVSGAVGNAWLLQAEAVASAVVRGAVTYEPSTDLRVGLELHRFATGVRDPILTSAGRRSQLTVAAFYRPDFASGSTWIDGSVDHITTVSGRSTSGRAGLSFQASEIRFLPSLRVQHDEPDDGPGATRSFLSLNTVVLPRPQLGAFLSAVSARTTMEAETSGRISTAALFLSRPAGPSLRVEAGASWMRDRGTVWSLMLSTNLPSVRAYSTMQTGGGTSTATSFVQGSVVYNPVNRSVALAAGPSLQRAGVSGVVFLDGNGNGRRDAGEEPLPDVRVRIGVVTGTSDSAGRYRIWDLLPYEPVLMVVDTASLASPLWVPGFSAALIEPAPNEFRTIDVPVAPGGVLEGRVVRATPGGPAGLGGVTVHLTHVRSGTRRTLVTFSDGGFYAIGVRPGEYSIEVGPGVLERLGARAEPVRFTLEADPDGATVSGLELIVRGADGSW